MINNNGQLSIANAVAGQSIELEYQGVSGKSLAMSQLYQGGSIVPNGSGANIPTSGKISMSNFYGSAKPSLVQFVAQAYNTDIFAYTKDAKTWTQSTLPSSQQIFCGICVNEKWIMPSFSSATVFNSNDGINWTSSALPYAGIFTAMAYGNGVYIIIDTTPTANYLYSTDGVNWVVKTFPSSQKWSSICYGDNMFVVSSESGNMVIYSNDGINWQVGTNSNGFNYLAYGNGLFIGFSSNGTTYFTSQDAKTWTQRTLPISTTLGNQVLTYGNGVFVLVPNNGILNILTSPDGVNWTQYNSGVYGNCITFGNGLFLITSNTNFSTSPDGKTWTQGNMPSSRNWITAISSNANSSHGVSDSGDDDPDPEKGT